MATVFTSWKEIATYLGRGVRTVQRWERDFGLPVRRTGNHGPKHSVLATSEEIDIWVKSQEYRRRRIASPEAEVARLRTINAALRAENAALRNLIRQIQEPFSTAAVVPVQTNSPRNFKK
jgi:hypothetical protein